MTSFEAIGVNYQYNANNIKEANKAFEYSCYCCCTKGIHISCAKCAIANAHELIVMCLVNKKHKAS